MEKDRNENSCLVLHMSAATTAGFDLREKPEFSLDFSSTLLSINGGGVLRPHFIFFNCWLEFAFVYWELKWTEAKKTKPYSGFDQS